MGFLDIFKPSTIKKGADVIFAKAMEHSTATTVIGSTIGIATTVVLTWRARPKVDRILEEKKEQIEEINSDQEMTDEEKAIERKKVTRSTIKEVTCVVAPPAISAIATVGFDTVMAVCADKAVSKWQGIAIGSDLAYRQLDQATREVLGDEKYNEVKSKEAEKSIEEKMEREPDYIPDVDGTIGDDLIWQAKGGNQLFYDAMYMFLFKSDEATIWEVCNNISGKIATGQEPYVTYGEFLTEMELPHAAAGDDRAWGGLGQASYPEPNMNNTIKVGTASAIVLDWYTRPSLWYK